MRFQSDCGTQMPGPGTSSDCHRKWSPCPACYDQSRRVLCRRLKKTECQASPLPPQLQLNQAAPKVLFRGSLGVGCRVRNLVGMNLRQGLQAAEKACCARTAQGPSSARLAGDCEEKEGLLGLRVNPIPNPVWVDFKVYA